MIASAGSPLRACCSASTPRRRRLAQGRVEDSSRLSESSARCQSPISGSTRSCPTPPWREAAGRPSSRARARPCPRRAQRPPKQPSRRSRIHPWRRAWSRNIRGGGNHPPPPFRRLSAAPPPLAWGDRCSRCTDATAPAPSTRWSARSTSSARCATRSTLDKVHHAYLFVGSRGTGQDLDGEAAGLRPERRRRADARLRPRRAVGAGDPGRHLARRGRDGRRLTQLSGRHPRAARERGARADAGRQARLHPRRGAHADDRRRGTRS